MTNELLAQEWALDPDVVHLNHAAVAPWPRRTQKAIEDFTRENVQQGSKNYLQWMAVETELRKQLRQLINAPSIDDIALLKNTSEGLSIIAYGLPWSSKDNVVISNEEFPSNRIVWESLSKKYGIEVRYADLHAYDTPEEALITCCNENTRLVSISSVQYASGLKVKLEELGAFCTRNDILFCVDAIQSLGAFEFDVVKNQADFVVADAHKWMLGPEGIALFYIKDKVRDRLSLNQYGWHMIEKMGDFAATDWEIASSARRFECGSPNMLGIHAFNASLSLIHEVGMSNIESAIIERVQYLVGLIDEHKNITQISRNMDSSVSGIVCFKPAHGDVESIYEQLQKQGVLCALRGGGIRFSPHYYTPFEKIKYALELAAN